jgi:hypothetical protein
VAEERSLRSDVPAVNRHATKWWMHLTIINHPLFKYLPIIYVTIPQVGLTIANIAPFGAACRNKFGISKNNARMRLIYIC